MLRNCLNNFSEVLTIKILDNEYTQLLSELKEKIRNARLRAALSVNKEAIHLYWYIGKQIVEKQEKASWGEHFLQNLSRDLQVTFPETRGFS